MSNTHTNTTSAASGAGARDDAYAFASAAPDRTAVTTSAAGSAGAVEPGTLYLCATPIGNLEDITLRVLNTLRAVDLIAAEDTRNTLKLLNHYDIHKPLTSYHEHNKYDKANELIGQLRAGRSIALVSDAGTPVISDPGEVLAAKCIEQGIRVTSLPGACALITALTMSGMPARRFVFEGFLPADRKERARVLASLRDEERTIILYEAPHRLRRTLRELDEALSPAPGDATAAHAASADSPAAPAFDAVYAVPGRTTVSTGSAGAAAPSDSGASHSSSAPVASATSADATTVSVNSPTTPNHTTVTTTPAARRIVLCRELTKRYEEAIPTTLPEAISFYEENEPRGEYVLILEGANPAMKKARQQAAWSDLTVEEHMAYYETQGIARKEAMKRVAQDRGVSKRDIYRALLPDEK